MKAEVTSTIVRLEEQMARLFADSWPAFITADQEVKKHIGVVRQLFTDLDLVLHDDEEIVATGWAVPIPWTGSPDDLPAGYTAALRLSVEANERRLAPNTLVIMGAQIRPDVRGQGIATELLTALRELAHQRGWTHVIAPVRPTLKSRYPLTSIERFCTWTRPDGTLLDPWMRTHQRMGATVLAPAPHSQVMTGSVAEWETWTGLAFPDSGSYVIPDGLSTLLIDHEADTGTYVEPNVWMKHV